MIISALKFKSTSHTQARLYRFSQTSGRLRQIQVFCDAASELPDIGAALSFALSGKHQTRILEAAVQMSDESGDTWIVERSAARLRVLKNGKAFDDALLGLTLLHAALQTDAWDDQAQNSAQGDAAVALLGLDIEGDELLARQLGTAQKSLQKLQHISEQRIDELCLKAAQRVARSQLCTPQLIVDAKHKLAKIYGSFHELRAQQKALLQNEQAFDGTQQTLFQRLGKEIELIDEMDQIARPLLDPAQAPQVLKEKLAKIETEIAQGMKSCNITELPVAPQGCDWGALAAALCKMDVFEKLIAASERARAISQQSIVTHHRDYLSTLETFVKDDVQITGELESCLQTLSLSAQQAREEQKKKDDNTVMGRLSRFVRPSAGELKAGLAKIEDKTSKLEGARMMVDYALTKMGEIHASLQSAKKELGDWTSGFDTHHDDIVREYGRLREHWQRLAAQANLPQKLSVNDLIRIASRYTYLNDLWLKRKEIRGIAADRRSRFSRLAQLLLEWRRVTESQKDVNPEESPSLLLSEVQSILRYRDQKLAHRQKISAQADEAKSLASIRASIDMRLNMLLTEWRRAFAEWQMEEVSIDAEYWMEFFAIADEIAVWQRIYSENRKPWRGVEVFRADSSDAAFTVFVTQCQGEEGAKLRHSIIDVLAKAALKRTYLILTSDQKLTDELKSRGAATARYIEVKVPEAPAKPVEVAPAMKPAPVLAPKVQAKKVIAPMQDLRAQASGASEAAGALSQIDIAPNRPSAKTQAAPEIFISQPDQSLENLARRAQDVLDLLNGRLR